MYADVLHEDAGLLQLLIERVPVVRIAVKRPGTHDQVALERTGNAHLHAELVGCPGLALADAAHLGGVPGVELAPAVDRLALAALGHDARGLVQGMAQCFSHRRPNAAGLESDFAAQAGHDGSLAPDGAAQVL